MSAERRISTIATLIIVLGGVLAFFSTLRTGLGELLVLAPFVAFAFAYIAVAERVERLPRR